MSGYLWGVGGTLLGVLIGFATEIIADHMLPVVESYAAQKAAEELEAAALDWPPTWAASPSDYLHDRAAALSPATEKEKR